MTAPDPFVENQSRAWVGIVDAMIKDPEFRLLNRGSVNGPGSSLEFTRGLREELPRLLRSYGVQTLVDAPCGDMTWASQTDLRCLHSYFGYDVDRRIIDANKKGYRDHPTFTFVCSNILARPRFPKVDLILCRDFLAHLPTEHIQVMLRGFIASGSTYLLASNYPGESNDFEYIPEDYPWLGYLERPHDLTQEPFNLTRIDGIPEASAPGGILAHEHELALFKL